ncbi:nucleotidyltransferase domain-containing protein [bacterium]|nr:nucleotidyltransferase domain-containing protein [bacterium]
MFPGTPDNFGLDRLSGLTRRQLVFSAVTGSHAYGTETETSDVDIRGIFGVSAQDYLALAAPPEQLADDRNDITYYSLRRFIELAATANPNIIELLYSPVDCILLDSPAMQLLRERRSLFITRQAYDSHLGYARAQISKARGQNKWVNNPQPQQEPEREDFCWVVPAHPDGTVMPLRPVPLADSAVQLEHCHASSLEHARGIYRLYDYGSDARGVFRNGNLQCESIPLQDEHARFCGLLIYNHDAYQQAKRDHENYWHWMATRNKSRWRTQESGEIDYDAKNMLHCIRLILSGASILRDGAPLVRFEGEQLQLLREIRSGRFSYDELISLADEHVRGLEQLLQHCSLPAAPDMPAVEALLREATALWENGNA